MLCEIGPLNVKLNDFSFDANHLTVNKEYLHEIQTTGLLLKNHIVHTNRIIIKHSC